MIVCSDHSQSQVEQEIDLFRAFDGFAVQPASKVRARAVESEIAVCPASRSAQVYVLDPERARRARAARGAHAAGARGRRPRDAHDRPPGRRGGRSAARRGDETKELRFAPRGDLADLRGERWSVEGDLDLLGAVRARGPDRLGDLPRRARPRLVGAALPHRRASCSPPPRPGYEFLDWGGAHHVGGGSHGALHANDSLGSLIWCGTGPPGRQREQWSLRDIVPMIDEHFGVERAECARGRAARRAACSRPRRVRRAGAGPDRGHDRPRPAARAGRAGVLRPPAAGPAR